MSYALIENATGRVAQISQEIFPISAGLEWVDITGVSPQPEADWQYDGGGFAARPVPTPVPVSVQIKAEARRRILAVFPDWKQTNMVARGVELVRIKAEGGAWSTGEAVEAAALDAAWAWIKSVRAASDALELDPPADFAADQHWPEYAT